MSPIKFQRGVIGYARIMRLLLDEPRPSIAIANVLGVSLNGMRHILRGLHKERLVHVAKWAPPCGDGGRGCYRAVWAVGDAPDAPPPSTSRGRASQHPAQAVKGPRQPLVEIIAFAEMWRSLEGRIGAMELADHMGSTRYSVYRLLRELRRLNLAHIAEWERRIGIGGAPTPLWQIAFDKRDVSRPRPQTADVIGRRYREGRQGRELTLRVSHALAGTASNFARFKQTEAA